MLQLPNDPVDAFTLVGLDPGSDTFGIAVFEVRLSDSSVLASQAWTVSGSALVGKLSWMEEVHSHRIGRIDSIENNLLQLFTQYRPLVIVTESPFVNTRFPQAGIALTEVMCGIRSAVRRYDVWRPLYTVPPSNVKNAVGAGGAAKKDVMREKVLALPDLAYNGVIPLDQLDEHSIDALAVGYCMVKRIRMGHLNGV
jgi:Holliday junction resolvasome RuvABC endonuclease subunit